MLRKSEQVDQLAKALSAAQGVMEGASKDKVNPHFKSKYADLGSVWGAIREPLAKHGLSVVQLPFTDEQGRVHVSTLLMHQSGQWIEASYSLPPVKNDPQGAGSAITYMKRYALTGMGVAPEDDDGEAASRMPVYSSSETQAPLDRPKNGNGNKSDPRLAAIQWADTAEKSIKGFTRSQDLRAWEVENGPAMRKLHTVSKASHDRLAEIVNEKYLELKANILSAG